MILNPAQLQESLTRAKAKDANLGLLYHGIRVVDPRSWAESVDLPVNAEPTTIFVQTKEHEVGLF